MRTLTALTYLLAVGCAHSTTGKAPGTGPVIKPNIDPGRPPAPGGEAGVRYRPAGTRRYALYRRDSVTVQIAGGEPQVQTVGHTAYLTIGFAATAAGTQIEITVDSIRLDADAAFPQIMVDSAVGTRWTGGFSPDGRLEHLVPSKSSLVGDQMRTQLNRLFPVLPAGGVRVGAEWTDSSSNPFKTSTFDATEQGATTYHATAQESRDGAAAIRIEGVRSATLAGTSNQFGQDLALSGTASTTVVYYLATAGRLLSAEGAESTDLSITVQSVGQTVPAKLGAGFALKEVP